MEPLQSLLKERPNITGKRENPVREYRYNCVNKSLLEPLVKKYYVSLYFQWIPRKLTANWITLVSCAAMWGMLYLVFHPHKFSVAVLAIVFAFLIHFYMVGDILDGMQAKVTGTCSPLGEFMDHYFDVYNGAIALAACFALIPIEPAVFYPLLWLSYLAFAATMMEERERGQLYFGPIGSLEGIFFLLIFYLSCLFPAGQAFWRTPLWNGIPGYWILILLGGMGYLLTVLDIFKRLGYSPPQFTNFVFGSFLLSIALAENTLPRSAGWFILAFYCGDYIGKVMDSYFRHGKHPYPDFFSTAGIVFLFADGYVHLLTGDGNLKLMAALGIYMGLKCLWNLGKTLAGLRRHWLWVNP
ncbi:MAG: CDP-alcohol phosphatidyltransferase family protein [Nitrospinaceae bacterium]